MIDLRGRRPPEPAAFATSATGKIADARATIRGVVQHPSKPRHPKSSDFDAAWKDHKQAFADAQFGGKCAYCETRIRAGYPGDVEHYRPKAQVKEPKTRGNRDDLGKPPGRSWNQPTKPGYWWLAYEWSNYLYACNRCNGWKLDRFPLDGSRSAMRPGAEANEHALLLNPFDTDPEPHLDYDDIGEVDGVTDAGTTTIDVCGLDRRSLIEERRRIAEKLLKDFEDHEISLTVGNRLAARQTSRRLLEACRGPEPYAGMARVLVARKLQLDRQELGTLLGLDEQTAIDLLVSVLDDGSS